VTSAPPPTGRPRPVWSAVVREGVAARKLTASHAFHSPLMRPVLAEFEQVLATVAFSPPALPVVANVTGALDAAQAMTRPEYWLQQLIAPVQLGEAMTALAAAGASVFLEIGPRPVLAMLGPKILPDPALT
jgi:acyl transferase domain-containing protein